jgi:hypothetical protein
VELGLEDFLADVEVGVLELILRISFVRS